jgi:ketosteroid isomerase-like protein
LEWRGYNLLVNLIRRAVSCEIGSSVFRPHEGERAMSMKRQAVLLLFLALFQIEASCQKNLEASLIHKYLQARVATMQLDATPKDIETVLAFCTDDFVYEHPAAKARIAGKDQVRAGMTGYLGLTKSTTYRLRMLSSNHNVVIAKVEMRFIAKLNDGSWKPSARTNLTVFEIENGKIKRILDY